MESAASIGSGARWASFLLWCLETGLDTTTLLYGTRVPKNEGMAMILCYWDGNDIFLHGNLKYGWLSFLERLVGLFELVGPCFTACSFSLRDIARREAFVPGAVFWSFCRTGNTRSVFSFVLKPCDYLIFRNGSFLNVDFSESMPAVSCLPRGTRSTKLLPEVHPNAWRLRVLCWRIGHALTSLVLSKMYHERPRFSFECNPRGQVRWVKAAFSSTLQEMLPLY